VIADLGALEGRLRAYSLAVDDAARKLLESDPLYAPLYDMHRYHLGFDPADGEHPGGKRLRPALCLLVAESLGADWRPALPAAVAVELVHQFSLIHDDIEDESRLRRHRETVWARWGIAQAINAGDSLLILAHQAITDVEPRLAPEFALPALAILDHACRDLCEGQFLDIAWEAAPPVRLQEYLAMVERKTARLFECAAQLGALCAGADARAQQQMGLFARALGLAFQVADDIVGVWSTESLTGKTAAEDIVSRKKALPATLGLANGRPEAQQLRSLFGVDRNLSESETAQAVGLLDAMGIKQEAHRMLERFRDEAVEHLGEAAPPARLADLLYLTELAVPGA
jgi:geranylgeranyl diphosphate synthase, type I